VYRGAGHACAPFAFEGSGKNFCIAFPNVTAALAFRRWRRNCAAAPALEQLQ
jgi:hypothetical protein